MVLEYTFTRVPVEYIRPEETTFRAPAPEWEWVSTSLIDQHSGMLAIITWKREVPDAD